MKYGYLAFEGFENELLSEIKFRNQREVTQKGRLFFLDKNLDLVWAQVKLPNIERIEIESINDAAKKLKSLKKHWAAYAYHLHRRTDLIQSKIAPVRAKKMDFCESLKPIDFGFWCLEDENHILKCDSTSKPLPLGQFEFNEDKTTPPSRAYLKLWEVFTCQIDPPVKNLTALDMGACPGGWSWVLQSLGLHVLSVDKAPLDETIQKLPHIQFIKKDAFKLNPSDVEQPDWFFSDIICDPKDLLELIKIWMKAYPKLKFVCTIKYKGETDFKITDQFLEIPNSRVVHLLHNKHEVTWIKI